MTILLGDKHRLAIEIGDEWWGDGLRRVDMWIADQWLTCDDNWLYVKSVAWFLTRGAETVREGRVPALPFPGLSAEDSHRRLRAMRAEDCDSDEIYFRHRYFDWGPTTDNVTTFAFRDGDRVAITVEFWREEHLQQHPEHVGQVFVAELEAEELARILTELGDVLQREPMRPAGALDISTSES
jgi:hypothetical protein